MRNDVGLPLWRWVVGCILAGILLGMPVISLLAISYMLARHAPPGRVMKVPPFVNQLADWPAPRK